MSSAQKLCFLFVVILGLPTSGTRENTIAASILPFPDQSAVIPDVYVTAYYCVYNSELPGSQTITSTISNQTFTLKASFLFGGYGVAMQGTGRTASDGVYIKYIGGGACFVHIAGPNAGRNLEGRWVINPEPLRNRYVRLGITDFTGFGNLALLCPDRAAFSIVPAIAGSAGRPLTPWFSIAVDPSLIPLGQTGILVFKDGITTKPSFRAQRSEVEESILSMASSAFIAQDTGGSIKGKHIDIYLGESETAIDEWLRSGGNRYADVYLPYTQ
jgi:3D (Asp-Asp-Asp) domain-containing protein